MKLKPLAITTTTLGVIAAALWFTKRDEFEPASAHPLVGQSALDRDTAASATHVTVIEEDKQPVIIEKQDNQWYLPDLYRLPVDFEKLTRLVADLMEMDVERAVTQNPERLEKLNIGTRQIAFRSDDKELWKISTGISGPNGGQFIQFSGEDMAFFTPDTPTIESDLEDWSQKRVLNFERKDVAKIELPTYDSDQIITFTRAKDENTYTADFDLAEEKSLKQSEIIRVINGFINARYTDTFAADSEEAVESRESIHTVRMTLFDGSTYTIDVAQKPEEIIMLDEELESEEQANSSEEGEEPATQTIPAGPVFLAYSSSNPDFPFANASERVALKYADYVSGLVPDSIDEFINKPSVPEITDDNLESMDDTQSYEVPDTPLILAPDFE